MKTFIFFMVFIQITQITCSRFDHNIIGHYHSPSYNLFDKVVATLNNTSHTVGGDLEVNKDSTFVYTTCGNILTGTWSTKSDGWGLLPRRRQPIHLLIVPIRHTLIPQVTVKIPEITMQLSKIP